MRLIHAARLELERFDDDTKIPPYAILSHTWGDDEVSLQQFQDAYIGDQHTRNRVQKMLGYAKIGKACKQATKEGYKYVWVDTCCIDKTSSAELSEAINSMFMWYKNAQVCYAFLEDVITDVQPTYRSTKSGTGAKAKICEDKLGVARWFTRGWTLQELIAPRHVQFYAAGWVYIGNKMMLSRQLTSITGIDNGVLRGADLGLHSVAYRMSWASKRKTTRIEDTAYSLMGLFDVNMPLLYGEGKKAFIRLQEEILKTSEDQSLFAWSPSPDERSTFEEWDSRSALGMGISVFAEHPREFAQASNIYGQTPQGEPTTVTNKGVKMHLPVLQWKELPKEIVDEGITPIFLAVLHCGYKHNDREHPAIVLRRLASDRLSHTYARHENAAVFGVMHDDVEANDARPLYLRSYPSKVSGSYLLSQKSYVWGVNEEHVADDPTERANFIEARVYKPTDDL